MFVGHLTQLKGIRDLVTASIDIKSEQPHNLEVVGDGPLRVEIDDAAARYPHIKAHGRLDRRGVRSLLSNATVLALPTQPHEGVQEAAGMVLLEAQSMGVPVLTYKTGGTPEMVASAQALVPCGDVGGLAQSLAGILSMDDAGYEALAVSARRWVTEHRDLVPCAAATRKTLVDAASEFAVDSV